METTRILSTTHALKWPGATAPNLIIESPSAWVAGEGFPVSDSTQTPSRLTFDTELVGGYVVVPDVDLIPTENASDPTVIYRAFLENVTALGTTARYPFGVFGRGFRVPVSEDPLTWQDIEFNNRGQLPPRTADRTVDDFHVRGNQTTDGTAAFPGGVTGETVFDDDIEAVNITASGVISGDLSGGTNLPGTPSGPAYDTLESDASGLIRYQKNNGGVGTQRIYRGDPGVWLIEFDALGNLNIDTPVNFLQSAAFATLADKLRHRGVVVYPPAVQDGVATAYAPDGTQVSTAGTHTSGLQEAIDYAFLHNCHLYVYGKQEPTHATLGCTVGCGAVVYHVDAGYTLDIPPAQGKVYVFEGCTINFKGTGTEPCLRFDSGMMLHVFMRGTQIVNVGRPAHTVEFKPRSPVPLDQYIGVPPTLIDSEIFIHTVSCGYSANDAADVDLVKFNFSLGSIRKNRFTIIEPNGGNNGFHVVGGSSSNFFDQNTVEGVDTHLQRNTAFKIGQGVSSDANVYGNTYRGNIDQAPSGVTALRGIDTYAKNDYFDFGVINVPGYTLLLQDVEEGNIFRVGRAPGGNIHKVTGNTHRSTLLRAFGQMTVATLAVTSNKEINNVGCEDVEVIVTGGVVSALTKNHNAGAGFIPTGALGGSFTLKPGQAVKPTFTGGTVCYGIYRTGMGNPFLIV
jgi:hypothetical protein